MATLPLAASVLVAVLCGGTSRAGAADRPTAPRLVPEKTLAYIRIADVNEMREAMNDSGVGRMMQDEQLKPLLGDLTLAVSELFAEASEHLGVSLDELLSIPQGEFAVAVVPMIPAETDEAGDDDESEEAIRRRIEERRNRSPVGVIGIVDTGENAYLMRRLIENLEADATETGLDRQVRSVAGTEIVTLAGPSADMPVSYAEREGTFVFGLGEDLVDDVLRRWEEGGSSGTLAQNRDFGNVMSHCVGAESTRPQLTFFADPYHLAELLVKQSGGPAGFVWPILEQLQLDKLQGVGGSSFAGGEDEFESILHIHVLLESPRDGILSVVRPGEGSVEPEDWIPADVISYTTLHWDVVDTYEGLGRIMARFQDADATKRIFEQPLKERTGLDLRADVLEQLTGRFSFLRWHELPMRMNSATFVVGMETKDAAIAAETLDKFISELDSGWKKGVYAGKTLYTLDENNRGNLPESFRRPTPAMTIVGNYILVGDSRAAIEHYIDTEAGSAQRLSDSPEYALIAAEVSGKLDAEDPFLFTYMRSEEYFRQIYDMAKDPGNRQMLRQAAENNRVAKMLYDALQKNELPAFSAFTKYFAPSGAFAYDDPTGLHYATFTLRPLE